MIQNALHVFLEIANTGIYKKKQEKTKKKPQQKQTKRKTQYPTTQTALFRALAFFLLKIWTLPYQSAWFMAVLLCSLFWHLAGPYKDTLRMYHGLWLCWNVTGCAKAKARDCLWEDPCLATSLSAHTLFSFPHLILVIRSLWSDKQFLNHKN